MTSLADSATQRLRLAVLISGAGRSLENLLQRMAAMELHAEVAVVISSRADAGGVSIANTANIPVRVIRRRDFGDAVSHRDATFAAIRDFRVDLVVMAGYLQHLLIADDFRGRVINIHPSLIPKYSGQGFYGLRVHQAVLDAGDAVTGCTVHYVDDEYDHGPTIDRRLVAVHPQDTAASLATRVFAAECELLPSVIQRFACGALPLS